jgi:hypothetical protein
VNNTVRERLVTTIRDGLENIGSHGNTPVVIEAGEEDAKLTEALGGGGSFGIELVFGDDEPVEPRTTEVEMQRFQVLCVVYLPTVLPEGVPPSEMAARLCADIYVVYGENLDAESWGGLALTTELVCFCGGVYVSDRGCLATVHSFEVTYRFKRGDPTVAA